MTGAPGHEDDLERRIIAGLQVRPRAPWALLADALGAPIRSVSRHGAELLSSGRVRVVAVNGPSGTVIARGHAAPTSGRTVLHALAGRRDCVFAYAVSGPLDFVSEFRVDDARFAEVALDELPAVPGLSDVRVDRVSRIYRSVREWSPDILTAAERAALGPAGPGLRPPVVTVDPAISDQDRALLRLLMEDGRMGVAELAARARLSENTVRRRVDWLDAHHYSRLRVVVEPALLGFPAEAMLVVEAEPGASGPLIEGLLESPEVRYLAALGGDNHLLVNVASRTHEELHDFVSVGAWQRHARRIDVAHVLMARKRSGYLVGERGAAASLY